MCIETSYVFTEMAGVFTETPCVYTVATLNYYDKKIESI